MMKSVWRWNDHDCGMSFEWFAHSLIVGAALIGWSSAAADDANKSNDKSDSVFRTQLQGILAEEANGAGKDRSRKINDLIQAIPDVSKIDLTTAQHQSGMLLLNGQWVAIDELQSSPLSESLSRYVAERGSGPLDTAGHRRMALWCFQHHLLEQCAAHWYGVLNEVPDHAEARQALGFQRIDNRWVSSEEWKEANSQSQARVQSLRNWMPRIRRWVVDLEGSDTKDRLKAIAQLKKISDPAAIPALFTAASQASSNTSMHLIQAISRFQTRDACSAMALIAVQDPNSERGAFATDELKKYPFGFYVSDLLDAMCSEFELKQQVVTRANGSIFLTSVQMRELRKHYEVAQLDKLMVLDNQAVRDLPVQVALSSRLSLIPVTTNPKNVIAESTVSAEVGRTAESNQRQVELANEQVENVQRRMCTVLRSTTGVQLGDKPQDWWEWWDRYEEVAWEGSKEYQSQYYEDTSSPLFVRNPVSLAIPASPRRHECLVAGTAIQTQGGLIAVEKVCVGDMVPSLDIKTGELSLQPVLRVTKRPPARTMSFVLSDGERIDSTLGHPWWVVGAGWTKTKDLKPGAILRTARGAHEIQSMDEGSEVETYNLVVANSHTYFIGTARLLSFDASELEPTFQKVPGLPAQVTFH
ncbi:MAG: polymorphic toxin-type HINT domain-containing protein [Planctomycetota bacterium]